MANGAAWAKLQAHYDETMQAQQMRDLFASDPARFEKFSATFHDILLDYSKNIVTDETMALLEQMCVEAKVLPMAQRYLEVVGASLAAGEGDLDNSAVLLQIERTPPEKR